MHLSPSDLRAILLEGEGKTTEFKRGLQRDATLARTLCAFANTRGGLLLVGVGDHGEVTGAPHPRETMRRLVEIARTRVDPPLDVEVVSIELEEGMVVCCSVPLSPLRPHAAIDDEGGREIFTRAGSSNRVASAATVAGMTPAGAVGEIETRVLEWIDKLGTTRGTVPAFARDNAVGIQRARGAFLLLERAGLLIGHGRGDAREFRRP